jgi:septal ring factor EnvC (AmiA/AmiB activator)
VDEKVDDQGMHSSEIAQLREQLEAERKKNRQLAFNVAELQKELAILSRELLQIRVELLALLAQHGLGDAERDLADEVASAASLRVLL